MNDMKTRLLPLALLLACCGIVVMIAYSPAIADDHRDDDVEDRDDDFEDDEEWEDEEEWEDWGMEEAMFEVEIMNQHLEMVHHLIAIAQSMNEVATDPTATAMMALMTAEDLAEEPDQLAAFLIGELQHIEDPAVRRAVRLKLVQTFTELERPDLSREHLSVLLRGEN